MNADQTSVYSDPRRPRAVALVICCALVAAIIAIPTPAFAERFFSVTVVWVDELGVQRPVPAATVNVEVRDLVDGVSISDGWLRGFTANYNGIASAFALTDLDSSEVRVSASAPGQSIGGVPVTTAFFGQSLTRDAATVLSVDSLGSLTIVLHPMTTVTGAVAIATGESVGSGASVLLWHRTTSELSWRPVAEVPTNGAGRFTAAGVPIGDYRFEIRSASSGNLLERTFHPLSSSLQAATSFVTGPQPSTDVGPLLTRSWTVPTERIRGEDRYATAIEISRQLYVSPFDEYWPAVVYLVKGLSYADALSASALQRLRLKAVACFC